MKRRLSHGLLVLFFTLCFTPAASAQGFGVYAGRTSFGQNKVQYKNFDWQIYESTHFKVYFYTSEEALLEKVVSFAESAYDELSRGFDFQIQEPIPLIFYATHSAFEQNNIFSPSIPVPEAIGAFATPIRNRMVLPVDLSDPELYELLLHELTHIFEYEILFRGRLGKGIRSSPPLWVMEGLASYMAKDEESWSKMYLRDAVVNDQVPSIAQKGVSGFFAYRFGHAAFDYIEERWGREGVRDFLFELRNTLGQRAEKALERALRVEAEDFDVDFRRWLRKRYLPQLVETGEPSDFGRPFRIKDEPGTQEGSAVASPSGDLVAAFSTVQGQIDVVLFDARKRKFLRNLTKGLDRDFLYMKHQFLSATRKMGRDLAFSPDGNTIAAFAKVDKGRALVLIDALNGGFDRLIEMDIEQQVGLAWSPGGRSIAFAGWHDGQFDIFEFDLESNEVRNVTNDAIFDGGPTYSPDGKSLVFSSVLGGQAKLFRIELDDPSARYQLTQEDEADDVDPVYSPDGARIYFTSNRGGVDNIYSLDLETGERVQHTNTVTGCFMPMVLADRDGKDSLVFTGYWKGAFNLYLSDLEEPIGEPEIAEISSTPAEPAELERFEPGIEVAVDDANKASYGGFRFFLEDAQSGVGISDDQTIIGQTILRFSDFLGDRRIIATFSSVASFQNFDLAYVDVGHRWQWSVHIFDDQDFFTTNDLNIVSGRNERVRRVFQQTGVIGSVSYPFNIHHRAELGVGYLAREFVQPTLVPSVDPETGALSLTPGFREIKDDFPLLQGALVADKVRYSSAGPLAGQRWRLSASWAPDTDESGTLATTLSLDVRKYLKITNRSNIAIRLFGGSSSGNAPNLFIFGGLDTVRGFDFRSLVGDRAFFGNFEFRFPVIYFVATPIFNLQGIRGRLFVDVGGAYSEGQDFKFWNSDEDRLQDGVSSYGFGLTLRFVGVDLNWDFAKQWDFDQTLTDGFETSFWIGSRF